MVIALLLALLCITENSPWIKIQMLEPPALWGLGLGQVPGYPSSGRVDQLLGYIFTTRYPNAYYYLIYKYSFTIEFQAIRAKLE